jgi:hypothetical protein
MWAPVEARRLKELERENACLEKIITEQALDIRGCLRSPKRVLEHASRGYEGPFSQPFLAVFATQKKPLVASIDPSQTPS